MYVCSHACKYAGMYACTLYAQADIPPFMYAHVVQEAAFCGLRCGGPRVKDSSERESARILPSKVPTKAASLALGP